MIYICDDCKKKALENQPKGVNVFISIVYATAGLCEHCGEARQLYSYREEDPNESQ